MRHVSIGHAHGRFTSYLVHGAQWPLLIECMAGPLMAWPPGQLACNIQVHGLNDVG